MRKSEKITALYERLSRDDFGKDDDQQRESNSISNQKAMLEEFAARQGFTNIVHFTDDGISHVVQSCGRIVHEFYGTIYANKENGKLESNKRMWLYEKIHISILGNRVSVTYSKEV